MEDKELPNGHICDCGFQFSGHGQVRNFNAYLDFGAKWCGICPQCGQRFLTGEERTISNED